MNLTCQEKAEELNNILGRIEQSTEVMAVLSVNHLSGMEKLQDEVYREAYISHLCDAGYDIVSNTNGAIGIYLRLAPELAGPSEGFYWLLNDETGKIEIEENTNLELYERTDIEHVGWYYEPVEAGQAVWIAPYENQNINRMIVSYVMPIYKENQLIGIVGMDIDWSYITDMVDEIHLYETGYAFLTNENFEIAYSQEFEAGTNIIGFSDELQNIDNEDLIRNDRVYHLMINGMEKITAFARLCNGKYMAVIVPTIEINQSYYQLVCRIITIALITSAVFVIITMQIVKNIIRPLKELNKAALDIAKGKLDVELNIQSDDEVGTLAESFRETAKQLKFKIEYINNLAYTDKLTGVKNNTAYLHDVAVLKQQMQERNIDFSVFVVDANGLKHINDNYGHELGNELIIKVTHMIADVFGQESLYRIGGDEFAVILYNVSKEEKENYQKAFDEAIDNQKGKIWASASVGSATYSKKTDSTYESVFNRADEDMYENKVRMKADGRNSRVVE